MLKEQSNDTDLAEMLVKEFGENQKTLATLVQKVQEESQTNFDPIARAKITALRREILIIDVQNQEKKKVLISSVLDQICSPTTLPKD